VRWKLAAVGFISKSKKKPDKIEVPADYQDILMKARPLLRKKFLKETDTFKRELLNRVIESNDLIINALA